MENFIYKNPTEIIFGRNRLHALKDQLLKRGYRSALVLYGGSHWKENGTLEQITTQLESCSISYFVQGGIRPNPKLSEVEQIVRNVKGDIVDVILALGGGSVIDTAKAVAVCLAVPSVRLQDILLEDQKIKQALDVGVISTIAGSGSESSCSMVITIDEGNLKRACDDEQLYPVFAILDPILTFTLPYYQMVSGACDILMHAMERYFSPTDNTELIDSMCEGLMRVVISSIEKSIKNPQDYEARANLMWAALYAITVCWGQAEKKIGPVIVWSMSSADYLMLSMEQACVPYGEAGLPMSGHIIRNDLLPLPVKSWV